MVQLVDAAAERRLGKYVDAIGQLLGNKGRRESFAVYALGLLGSGERKSIEPIAARACADPAKVPAMEARLGHFLNDARWSDTRVRAFAAEYAIEEMTRSAPISTWIVDDTGFLKQGTHSVGVQRQYTGSAGKTTNCQVAVSLSVATENAHLPIDFELYLPEAWTSDPARRVMVPENLRGPVPENLRSPEREVSHDGIDSDGSKDGTSGGDVALAEAPRDPSTGSRRSLEEGRRRTN